MSHYEIVKVIDAAHLQDSANRRLKYATSHTPPLQVGAYYAVLWDDGISLPRYDDDSAFYCGPYALPHLARRDSLEHLRAFRARDGEKAALDPQY